MSDYSDNPEYFDPATGKPRTFESRKRYRDQQNRAKQLAAASAAHAARKAAKPKSGYEDDIAEMKKELRRPHTKKKKDQLRRRLVQYEDAHERWESEQIVIQFEKDFDKSELAKLAGQSVEAIRRSGPVLYPNASAEELNELLALFDVRHDFPTPGDFAREFFVALGAIEDKEAEAAQKTAEDSRIESERLQAESANAQLKAAQAQQRAEAARGALDE